MADADHQGEPGSTTTPEDAPDQDGGNRATIAAALFVVVLLVFCVWLFNKLSDANASLNCVASGRTNCADLVHPSASP